MSYYRPSFSQTVAMSRGRGFSSSYRGSSGRNSWGGGPPDRGRGNGYGSSRGRFSSSFSNSMDSRSKYPSNDRYSGGSRNDFDDYHNKSYRSDLSGNFFGGRDSHRSPERKRMRPDAPSSRRSHEGESFNNSGARYHSNSFNEDRSFSRDRRPASFSRREEIRKPLGPPPSNSPRGGYRGRISSRGIRAPRIIREGVSRRRLVDNSYVIRRRTAAARVSLEYRRSLKMNRLRSAAIRRTALRRRQISDKEESDKGEKSDEEANISKKAKEEGGSDAENEDEKKEDESEATSTKKDAAVDDKEEKAEETETKAVKSPKKDYIKLVCPHCNTHHVTFVKYSVHLHGTKHMLAMKQVSLKQKTVLSRMRLAQRIAQRELEKTTDDLAPRTNFCPLCKLNYKQPKATHQASDSHKNMKKFLMPYCRVCRITFKSPMLYETHICSIEHIKRKARTFVVGEKSDKDELSANDDDNLENFMTIDSIGDLDDEEGKKKESSVTEKPKKEPINVGIEQIRKVEVYYCELCRMYLPRVEESELETAIAKHCKQRNHMRCYIRYNEDKELTSRAERLQRKETAEKEREKKKVTEEGKTEDAVTADTPQTEKDQEKTGQEEENIDDKLWAHDVNKDLGDILAEAESGNKSSDEDEDLKSTGERYDKFRYSKKNGEDEKVEEEEPKTDGKESNGKEENIKVEAE